LPTLAGAGIYLVSVYLLCRRLFGNGLVLLLSLAMLAWNPLVRDFMVAARGFGLGSHFLMLAMYFMPELTESGEFRTGEKEWRRGCAMASVALALSVAAKSDKCFSRILFDPSFSDWWDSVSGRHAPPGRSPRQGFCKIFHAPGLAVGLFLLWPYLIQMRRGQFQIALTSATAALRDIFMASFSTSGRRTFTRQVWARWPRWPEAGRPVFSI